MRDDNSWADERPETEEEREMRILAFTSEVQMSTSEAVADLLIENHRIRQDILSAVKRAGLVGFGVSTTGRQVVTVTIPYIDDSWFGKIRKAADAILRIHGVDRVDYRMVPAAPDLPGAIDVYY